jgi:acyl carrier protein
VMRESLRAYILETFMFGASPDELDDDVSLLQSGILDSTGVLELILHLEQQHGVSIDATELMPENLDSINRVLAFLARKGAPVNA